MVFVLSGCSAQNTTPKFDSQDAFSILQKQCDFGPRPVGTKAHDQTRDYLVSELQKYSDKVESQNFTQKVGGKELALSNVIARFGSGTPGILLCAHWDTRPTADQELEVAKRKIPIMGADDGASGVAVLLELARMFHEKPPAIPVTIVLFDGEDYGPSGDDMFLGSSYFAKNGHISDYKFGILLDMVGDKQLELPREGNSQDKALSVTDKVWAAGKSLGYGKVFSDNISYSIGDDHIPLINAGLPCTDVIDFNYAYWHTTQDTVDKCSPESLKIVGDTVAKVVYTERPKSGN